MKSVKITDRNGVVLVKVISRKDGYEAMVLNDVVDKITIEIRDDKNCKVYLSNIDKK